VVLGFGNTVICNVEIGKSGEKSGPSSGARKDLSHIKADNTLGEEKDSEPESIINAMQEDG
jgi:hypothetical protein